MSDTLMLSFILYQDLASCLFPFRFPYKIFYTFYFPPRVSRAAPVSLSVV